MSQSKDTEQPTEGKPDTPPTDKPAQAPPLKIDSVTGGAKPRRRPAKTDRGDG